MTECTHCRKRYDDSVRFCPVDGFAVAPVAEPFIGRLLMGQFQIQSVCGHGATGTVYRAVQAGMERAVAVKVLRADLLKDADVVRRFVREARAGAKLNHQNIATVHLVGQTDEGVPFIVMEYVEGLALASILAVGKPLPLGRIAHLGTQIASALSEAHSQGIVHRDLKPENILLTERRGETDVVKVVDFGIAKMIAHAAPGEDPISRMGTVFGTPHYIAPEQASGQAVDGRADIYSLGCILYQMATGHVPFEGQAGLQVLLSQVRDKVPDPRMLNPRLGAPLAELILRMLEKAPADRPPTAELVGQALQELAAGRAVEPRPVVVHAAELRPASARAAEP
ncbi:MAG TPA: serine/threonine-protein kinase, partial [Pseudomonadota bacterium]|nr:serine/threonine-protein kinase [Pseudomonadota bacterium]